jgi:hypothetical protein
MIFLPTRGRPQSILRFIECYHRTEAKEPVLLVTDHDDRSYDAITLPANFSIKVMPPHGGIGECMNAAFADHPNEVYYGLIADDVVPETPRWDQILINACLPYGISWGDDGVPGINLPTHPFIAGDLVRAIGWIACPTLKHWYTDNVCHDIAVGIGCGKFLPEVKLPHYHVFNDKAELDDTYLNQPSREKDKAAYLKFRQEELPGLLQRIRK